MEVRVFSNRFRMKTAIASLICVAALTGARAEDIGSADTVFKLIEEKYEVFVDAVDDPIVEGVSCYVALRRSRPTMGGSGVIGVTEPSQISIACRRAGPIRFR